MSILTLNEGTGVEPAPVRAVPFERTRQLFFLLSLANFTIGFGAFVVVAILGPLASDLGIDPATAGWSLTAYAAAYAIGSPVGVALTGRFDRRAVLSGGLTVFGVGAVMAAFAPSFAFFLVARIVMALGGGVVTPVAASVAIGLVAEKERGHALAFVFGGLTLAQAIGIPAGAWLSDVHGWRSTFAAASVLAFPAAFLLWRSLPVRLSAPVITFSALGRALRRPDLVAALLFTVLFMAGVWTVYTYFGLLFEDRLSAGGTGIAALMFVFGIGAVLGNILGGRMTDGIGSSRTLVILAVAQIVLMPMLTLFPISGYIAAAVLVFLWSLAAWSFMVPQQARLAALEPGLTPILFSLNAAAIYVAASLGGTTGATVLAYTNFDYLGPVGAAIALLAFMSLPVARHLRSKHGLSETKS